MNECPICKKTFKHKSSLRRHTKTAQYCITQRECRFCRSRPENPDKHICKIADLKSKIELDQKYHQDLQEKIIKLKTKISVIQKQNNKLLRRPTNNINVKTNIKNKNTNIIVITPKREFTSSQFIDAIDKEKFTLSHLKQGVRGIARFIAETVLDEKGNPNYVVCDTNRINFRYYFKDLWKDDIGGRKLVDEVYPHIVSEIDMRASIEMSRLRDTHSTSDLSPIYITPEYCIYLELVGCIKRGSHHLYEGDWNTTICKELKPMLKHYKQLLNGY